MRIVSVQFCKQVISKWFRPILKTRRGLNEFTNNYKTSASEIIVIFPAQHSSSPTSSLTNCFLFAYIIPLMMSYYATTSVQGLVGLFSLVVALTATLLIQKWHTLCKSMFVIASFDKRFIVDSFPISLNRSINGNTKLIF